MLNIKKHLHICSKYVTFVVGKRLRASSVIRVVQKQAQKKWRLSQATTFTNYDKNKINFSLKIGESILPNKRTLNAN
jgi:hypothetical protein